MAVRARHGDERQQALSLLEALGSSLDVRVMLREAYPRLARLVPADYGALGVSSSARGEDFEWTVAELPTAFFAAYGEMAEHDFVRRAVLERPNRVLRDQDMVPRAELEANVMYRRAREVGAPLEHVMAVMLHVDERWQSGLSLYRDRRRPFTQQEQARLQRVTPALANAVRNCHLFGLASDWQHALELLLQTSGTAVLLATEDGTEVARSPGATAVLERWFVPHERRDGHLPAPLGLALADATRAQGLGSWRKCAPSRTLEVSILPLTGYFGAARWLLRLEERLPPAAVPAVLLALLTPREAQVVTYLAKGWDNQLIAAELGCAQATVKKHLQSVFKKLGVENRTALVVRLTERRPD